MKTKYVLFGLTALMFGLVLVLLLSGENRQRTRHIIDRGPVVPQEKPLPPPPLIADTSDAPPPSRKAPETLTQLVRVGALGHDPKWISPLMKRGAWTQLSKSPLVFEGHEGIKITWLMSGGIITGARADFPEGSMSASATGLSPYFVGEHLQMPVHFESVTPLEDPVIFNNFINKSGRRFFVMAQMRTSGPAPYGPEVMKISLMPFEGQSHAQSPQTDRWTGVEEREETDSK